jgi:hypothetical protein
MLGGQGTNGTFFHAGAEFQSVYYSPRDSHIAAERFGGYKAESHGVSLLCCNLSGFSGAQEVVFHFGQLAKFRGNL